MNCRTIVLLSGLLSALLAAGCSSDRPPVVGPGGRTNEVGRYDPLPVDDRWKADLLDTTLKLATDNLAYPTTGKIDGPAHFEADYDKTRRVTQFKIFGNAVSEGPYGQHAKQSYFIIWEKVGDIRHPTIGPQPEWKLGGLKILDFQYEW